MTKWLTRELKFSDGAETIGTPVQAVMSKQLSIVSNGLLV